MPKLDSRLSGVMNEGVFLNPFNVGFKEDCGFFHGCMRPRICPPGETLLLQGYVAEDVYLVERGIVKLTRISEDGKELIVGLRSSGWLLGSASAVLGVPNPVSITALNQCQLRYLPADSFIELVKT